MSRLRRSIPIGLGVLGLASLTGVFGAPARGQSGIVLVTSGAELIGEVVQYGDAYKLCYMRGPAGIIVALAEELG